MSKYSQEEQSNIVGMAAELEVAIITENEELSSLKAEKRSLPEGPKMKVVKEPQYVKQAIPKNRNELFEIWVRENGGFLKILFLHNYLLFKIILSTVLAVGGMIILFLFVNLYIGLPLNVTGFLIALVLLSILFTFVLIIKSTIENKYNNSDSYKKSVAQATDAVNKELYNAYLVNYQAAANEYNEAVHRYNTEILPKAQKEYSAWNKSHNAKIAFVENDLKDNMDALSTLYTSTQLIPSSYRTIDRLTWLYEDMSTSEHDIERAIDLLNSKEIKEELINIQGHVEDLRKDIRAGFVGVYEAIQVGNAIQSEMLSNLDAIRKSARIGNFVNVGNLLQNHNRNKMLSQINETINK